MHRWLRLLAIYIGLSGCASWQNIHPEGRLLNAGIAQAYPANTTNVPVRPSDDPHDWWADLGDAQIPRLIEQALNNNPNLEASAARVRKAYALAGVATAQELPDLDLTAGAQRTRWSATRYYPAGYSGKTDWNDQVLLNGSFTIDIWGRQRHEAQGALNDAQAAALDHQQAALLLSATIVRVYAQMWNARQQTALLEQELHVVTDLLRIVRQQADQGLNTQLAIDQVSKTYLGVEADLSRQRADADTFTLSLVALTGNLPGNAEHLAAPNLSANNIRMPASVPLETIGNRPDVAAARMRVEAALNRIEVAKEQFLPNIDLAAFVGYSSLQNALPMLFRNPSETAGIGPALTLPIFEGGRLRENLKAKTADYDESVAQFNSTVLTAAQEIGANLSALRQVQTRVNALEEAKKKAEEMARLQRRGFEAGIVEYANVLSADLTAIEAQRTRVIAIADEIQIYATLMQAMGR